jgi:voltage-gated potassium channel
MNRIKKITRSRKYNILLFSFLLLMFGDTFVPEGYSGVAHLIFILQNMFVGLIIFYRLIRLRYLIITTILISVLMRIIELSYNYTVDLHRWLGLIYILYYLMVAGRIYKDVYSAKTISTETLSAVLCGFILLCLTGTFLFFQIEVVHPDSFSGLGQKNIRLSDLNYFSLQTLTTTCLGDVKPVTLVAKRAVMLISFIGHFYSVFIISIMVGKYISHSEIKFLQNKKASVN